MTIRKIHSAEHLVCEIDRMRSLWKIYVPSKARDRLRRDIQNLVNRAVEDGVITQEEKNMYAGPPLE
jgi:hypothetical protein